MPSIKAQSRFYVNPYMWVVIFFVFFFLLYLLRSVLMPFVAGILLAYLLDPLTLKLQKCKMSRTWATVLVCFLMILIVLPAIFLFLGMVESQVTLLCGYAKVSGADSGKGTAGFGKGWQNGSPG